ncbi:hypothetical protein NEIG_01009 [Nematocida sp. ERTm5]|nr:hypothetical protein NEIG_01009 [Nematocida sp. ERTm5]
MELEKTSEKNPHLTQILRKGLPDKLSSNMEIEIRFGTLMDKATQKRLSIKMLHPCIMERSDTLWFEASVTENDFAQMKKYFSTMFKDSEEKLIIDTLLKGIRRSEVREINGESVRVDPVIIKKKKLFFLDIFCPFSKYDMRISVCEEIVQKDTFGMQQVQGNIREKKRTTYTHPLFVVDVTEVNSGKESADIKYFTPSYEIEIEANNKTYKKDVFINIVNNSIDAIRQALKHR